MTDRPSSLERALFDELVDLPPVERERRLEERCAGDPLLLARVQRLLKVAGDADEARDFLGSQHLQQLDEGDEGIAAMTPLPRPFGHFRLVAILGSGGMGLVYQAEQEHPQRSVALKVMRSEMVSRELVRRFRRETDTLARLQHPGIAHVYEAGSVADPALGGVLVPYIAMELVPGSAIDEFVRSARCDARTIVGLVAAACDAVQHAHERGVIHRDLKPANILVVVGEGNRPQPKILDFGIARLVGSDPQRGAASMATSTGQILGTLAYMSPEQMGGRSEAIDARTDLYALGTILFELLTGRLPLDVRELPIADVARIVRDEEPTRLGAVDRRLRGDLDTIVAKAIEKDPDRRYPSAAALAADLRRFLADEPIQARPTTRTERLRRLARRNRGVMWGGASTIVALAIGVVLAVAFAIKESEARRNAEWTSYRASVAAANAALTNNDVRSARQHLDSTPTALRGWEWRYLSGRLDQSTGRVPAAIDERIPVDQSESNLSAWLVMAVSAGDLASGWPAGCSMPKLAPSGRAAPADGATMLATDQARSAELWDASEGRQPRLLMRRRVPGADTAVEELIAIDVPEGSSIEVAAMSDDASKVAAVLRGPGPDPGGERLCWFRDLANGQTATIPIHRLPRDFVALALNDRGDVGIGSGPESRAVVWRPELDAVVPLGGELAIRSITFSHDGQRVAVGSQDSMLSLYSIDGVLLESERRHAEGIQSVRFSPDDTMLVTAGQEGTIGLWSMTNEPPDLSLVAMLVGHTDEVQAADFSADGRWIVSTSRDGTLRAWPTNRSDLVGDVVVPVSAFGQIDFSARGDILATASFHSIARLWDLTAPSPALLAQSVASSDRERVLGAVACSPDGSSIVTIEADGMPRIRTRAGSALEETWRGSEEMVEVGYTVAGQALGLLAGDAPVRARLRHLPTGATVELPLPPCASPGMASARDGRLLAVRETLDERHHLVHVLDAATGTARQSIAYGVGSGCALGELADGRAVIAVVELEPGGDPDLVRDVTIRDAWSGQPIARLPGHAAHLFSLAFTLDGRRLITGGRDGVLRVWDTETWEEVVGLAGPGGYLWALRFAPTGDLLVSGGSNGVYRFWRAPLPP